MFAPCTDMVKYRLFVQKKLHSKFSYGYVEGNFQNTSNKNSSENEKKSVQWAKKVCKVQQSSSKVQKRWKNLQSVILDTVDAVLTNPPKNFQIRAENLRSLYDYGKLQIFCSKRNSFKIFLRIRWRQFLNPPKNSSSKNEKILFNNQRG